MDGWIQEISEPVEPPNNSVARRPLKDGWLSPRGSSRRVNGLVGRLELLVKSQSANSEFNAAGYVRSLPSTPLT
ncbi:hypothetical protein PseudUWO311_16695 [Pseudanabaena sp. UWO311]|nr:hypothetical protein PseudUWO311_16695 [Pseudanabaena sp. UWO311]